MEVNFQLLLMQVPPCSTNLTANITCTIPEDVFASWPQLNRVAFYVYDNAVVVAQNVTAGRKLQASVSATAPSGVFLLSNYRVRLRYSGSNIPGVQGASCIPYL